VVVYIKGRMSGAGTQRGGLFKGLMPGTGIQRGSLY
jgi:hypothetical protein